MLGKVSQLPTFIHVRNLTDHPLINTALKFLSPNVNPPIPWYRVISSSGTISSRGPGTDGAQRQRQALEAEGVEVTDGRTGEMRVDLSTWGWFPEVGSMQVRTAGDDDDEESGEDEDAEEDS